MSDTSLKEYSQYALRMLFIIYIQLEEDRYAFQVDHSESQAYKGKDGVHCYLQINVRERLSHQREFL